ncbi:MAG: TerC family protein [Chloroflexi bacterium]|nr:TerC family protein [Chloroflexota bacterium]
MDGSMLWVWIGFNVFVLAMLALDLGVFHRHAHTISVKEALTWSVVWIAISLSFSGLIWLFWDRMSPHSLLSNSDASIAFLTGYLIEKALSVDNIFVIVLIFTYFSVPASYQHRVLFWGILGALVMRGAMIALGAALIEEFHWIIYVFGAFLIFTGFRMARQGDEEIEPEANPVVRLFRKLVPVTQKFEGDKFFIRQAGVLMATPLLLVLVIIETTDLIFAVDSIPAIFAVTHDPFIVYTSNIFAILGLRSLYFVLAGVVHKFHYLKLGLSVVLAFVGAKMLLTDTAFKIPTLASLAVIAAILTVAVVASLVRARRLETEDKVETSKTLVDSSLS